MTKALTKSEFMKLVINDYYYKRLIEKRKDSDYNGHTRNNMEKVQRRKRR